MENEHIYIKEKTLSGSVTMLLDAELLSERKIFLEGEINRHMAVNFIKQVMILTGRSKDEPIKVFINSQGGEVGAGMMIYDIITTCRTPMEMYCTGVAYSMAGVLFLSGKNGRYMLEHSKVMLHEPLVNGFNGGSASSVESVSTSLKDTKKQLDTIISRHTGRSLRQVSKDTAYDHYFSATEAVAYGIADGIAGMDDIM